MAVLPFHNNRILNSMVEKRLVRTKFHVPNLAHLISFYGITQVLCDESTENFVESNVEPWVNGNLHTTLVDWGKLKKTKPVNSTYMLQELDGTYDLLVLDGESGLKSLHLFHMAKWILIVCDPGSKWDNLLYVPYARMETFTGGVLYHNEFQSISFANAHISMREQQHVRDRPYRYLRKMVHLQRFLKLTTIAEIGSCCDELTHGIKSTEECCTQGHSTFHWLATKGAKILTVDTDPRCEVVFAKVKDVGMLAPKTTLDIYIMDGIKFLTEYCMTARELQRVTRKQSRALDSSDEDEDADVGNRFDTSSEDSSEDDDEGKPKIDVLYLDAWSGEDAGDQRTLLKAYKLAKKKLSETCLIAVAGTDLFDGRQVKLLLPVLLEDGFVILYSGRITVAFKGDKSELFVEKEE